MTDYFKRCTIFEEPLTPTDNGIEARERETLYRTTFRDTQALTKARNDHMRCLCWSHRYAFWSPAKGKTRAFWEDFTLAEARRQIRTRHLIDIIKQGKATGNGVIIFVQRTFQAELCIKASRLSQVQELTEDLRIDEVKVWVHRCEGSQVVREEV